ncbi:hypothetical protein HDU96_002984 [Phlyctochytrium bullatum]|nr:hypothetical protein HDU96_002984 [Phlyctochytrium bullatum]
MTETTPQTDDGTITLFQLTHVTADLIAAVIKLLHDHLGPDFAGHPDGTVDNASRSFATGDFVLSIAVPKTPGPHGAMKTLMTSMILGSMNGNGDGRRKDGVQLMVLEDLATSDDAGDETKVVELSNGLNDAVEMDPKEHRKIQNTVAGNEAVSVSSDSGNAENTEGDLVDAPELDDDDVNLHGAAARNDAEAVKNLLNAGADPFQKDSDGRLAIEMTKSLAVWKAFSVWMRYPSTYTIFDAVRERDAVAMRQYLAEEVDICMMDEDGLMARESIFKILVEADRDGASLKTTDARGRTPLHAAVETSNWDFCEILVNADRGAISMKDKRGYTPLHAAADNLDDSMCRILLAADPSVINSTDLRDLEAKNIHGKNRAGPCKIQV